MADGSAAAMAKGASLPGGSKNGPLSDEQRLEKIITLDASAAADELKLPSKQKHVLRFWNDLPPEERQQLAGQLLAIDFEQLDALWRGVTEQEDWTALARRAEPPNAVRLGAVDQPFNAEQAAEAGEKALRSGHVAALIVAGGQGTRLGTDSPKGTYSIGPVSGASLFQILVEKVLAARNRYGASIPLLVMTSPATHRATVAYFAEHNRFGLPAEDLRIFCQGTMPAVDEKTGELLLADRASLALSPDGHGGMLAALGQSGSLAMLQQRGIRQIYYFQVDNPLVHVAHRLTLGYHLLSGSQVTTKVVTKRSPKDKLGNVVSIDGRMRIIEYSDLPDDVAELRNEDQSLKLWAGNIAVHVFDVAFLERLTQAGSELPFHRAKKAVPFLDKEGNKVTPEKANAIKFEKFIFDTLPAADRALVVETNADDEFAAVKNAPGSGLESPEWVKEKMVAQFHRWLEAVGVRVAPGTQVEIGPLFACDEQELRDRKLHERIPGGELSDPQAWR